MKNLFLTKTRWLVTIILLITFAIPKMWGEAASLPVDYSFDDGRGALPTGVTQSGLGTDYAASNAPYRLKFDGNSDYIQIEVDGAVQDITIGIKQYATTAPKFQIKGSSDGSTFTAIESWTINPGQNKTDTRTTSNAINSSYRHFRVCKTDGGNAGLGILVINGACSAINVTGGGTVILPAGSTDYSANDWKKKGAPTAYAAQHEYNINGSCVTLTQAADFNDGNGLQLKASAGIITISSITSTSGIDVSVVIGNGSGISIALTDATTLTGQSTGTSNISTTSTSATLTISKTTSGVGYIKTITIAPKAASCDAPTGLTNGAHQDATTGTNGSQVVSWSGSAANYDICVNASNHVPTSETSPDHTGSATSYTINGKTPGTYRWWVRSNCGGTKSDWVEGTSFTIKGIKVGGTIPVNFGTVLQNSVVADKTITATGVGLVNDITPSVSSPFSASISGTTVTISASTATAISYDQYLTLTSGDYSATVRVTMTVQPLYTVTLMDDGSTLTQTTYEGSVTLPSRAGCTGYTFAGWTKTWTSPQSSWTSTAPAIINAGNYTPTGNENLYPVYTKVESGGTPETVTLYYEPFTGSAHSTGVESTNVSATTDMFVDGSATVWSHYSFNAASTTAYATNLDGSAMSNGVKIKTEASNTTVTMMEVTGIKISGASDLELSLYNRRTYTSATLNISYKIDDGSYTAVGGTISYNSTNDYWKKCTGLTISGTGTSLDLKIELVVSGNTNRTMVLDDIKITGETGGSTTYYISVPNCCTAYDITLAGSGSVGGGTFSASVNSACEGATITLSTNICSGYTVGDWDVYKTGASGTKITVTSNSFEMPAYDVTVALSTTAKVDHFKDAMHETSGYTGDGYPISGCNQTVPNLSNTTPASECEGEHYKFVGWVDEAHVASDGTLLTGYSIVAGGTTSWNATGTTYYAIWAKEL